MKGKEHIFSVYKHVNKCNGKIYVGITCREKPSRRWGEGGIRYKSNKHFWNAIEKYGWDNFEHIIIATGLSCEAAQQMEMALIAECKSDQYEYGYNQTKGGESGYKGKNSGTLEYAREQQRRYREDPDYRQRHIEHMRKLRQDPEYKRKRREKRLKKYAEDIEFRNKEREKRRLYRIRRSDDPVYLEKRRNNVRRSRERRKVAMN